MILRTIKIFSRLSENSKIISFSRFSSSKKDAGITSQSEIIEKLEDQGKPIESTSKPVIILIDEETDVELPPEPTDCCMSGCQNCVWIVYAETLTKMYDDGGEKAKKIILTRIQDPTMKVFLKMELSSFK